MYWLLFNDFLYILFESHLQKEKMKMKKEWLNGYGLICAWFLNRPAIHMSDDGEDVCHK